MTFQKAIKQIDSLEKESTADEHDEPGCSEAARAKQRGLRSPLNRRFLNLRGDVPY